MPTWGEDIDWKALGRKRAEIEKILVAKGLTPGTRKFSEVMSRKLKKVRYT